MKKISKKGNKLQCAFCQGKGTHPGDERLSCIVCGGRGRVTVRQLYNVCKECVGMGKKKGTNLYCLSCHGKGFIEKNPVKRTVEKKKKKKNYAKKRRTKKRKG